MPLDRACPEIGGSRKASANPAEMTENRIMVSRARKTGARPQELGAVRGAETGKAFQAKRATCRQKIRSCGPADVCQRVVMPAAGTLRPTDLYRFQPSMSKPRVRGGTCTSQIVDWILPIRRKLRPH